MKEKYLKIIECWNHNNIDFDIILSDKFLYKMVSSINKVENIDINEKNADNIITSDYVVDFTGNVRDLYSVLNNRRLVKFFIENLKHKNNITPELIKKSHKILMNGCLDDTRYEKGERAGSFKVTDFCVGKYEVGLPPEDVDYAIEDLCNLIKVPKDILKYATAFHCIFESIHPFSDGNGRLGRWLLNYYLLLHDHPPIIIDSEDRELYYKALEHYDLHEDFTLMEDFFMEQTIKTVEYLIR